MAAGDDVDRLIADYHREGYVVVPIFNADEVAALRRDFHASLGVDHEALLSAGSGAAALAEKTVGGVRAKSKAASVYAPQWKLDACCDARLLAFVRRLMASTFGPGNVPGFEHPMGRSDDVLLFLDGSQYRLPDTVRAEGGLGLHIDRNPVDPYLRAAAKPAQSKSKSPACGLTKWRPVQSFIALTDQFGSASGGLRVVPKFHLEFDAYFARCRDTADAIGAGEFYRLNPKTHASLWARAVPVNVPAGCAVFWDNRLPHATAERLDGADTREILYTAYLPAVPLNASYARDQLRCIRDGVPPPAFQTGSRSSSDYPPQYFTRPLALSALQRRLLGFDAR